MNYRLGGVDAGGRQGTLAGMTVLAPYTATASLDIPRFSIVHVTGGNVRPASGDDSPSGFVTRDFRAGDAVSVIPLVAGKGHYGILSDACSADQDLRISVDGKLSPTGGGLHIGRASSAGSAGSLVQFIHEPSNSAPGASGTTVVNNLDDSTNEEFALSAPMGNRLASTIGNDRSTQHMGDYVTPKGIANSNNTIKGNIEEIITWLEARIPQSKGSGVSLLASDPVEADGDIALATLKSPGGSVTLTRVGDEIHIETAAQTSRSRGSVSPTDAGSHAWPTGQTAGGASGAGTLLVDTPLVNGDQFVVNLGSGESSTYTDGGTPKVVGPGSILQLLDAGNPTDSASWLVTNIVGATADTNAFNTNGLANTTGGAISHDGAGENFGIVNIDNLSFVAQEMNASVSGSPGFGMDSTRQLRLGGYVGSTHAKTTQAARQLVVDVATGEVYTQALPEGLNDTQVVQLTAAYTTGTNNYIQFPEGTFLGRFADNEDFHSNPNCFIAVDGVIAERDSSMTDAHLIATIDVPNDRVHLSRSVRQRAIIRAHISK